MIIEKASVGDARHERSYRLSTNCYWVTLKNKAGTVVFERNPSMDEWLDEKHRAITDALNALEKAVQAAMPER